MNIELKKAIYNWICDNANLITAYIFTSDGNYLIGGEEVCKFIESECGLIVG